MILTSISLIILLVSIFLFKLAAGRLSPTRLNLISFTFYYHFIAHTFIASILAINNLDHHYLINKATDEAIFKGWYWIQYAMVATPASMVFINCLSGSISSKKKLDSFLNSPTKFPASFNGSYFKISFHFFTILSILSVFYTYLMMDTVPLFSLLNGATPSELAELRINAHRHFSGNTYIRNLLALQLTPLLSLIALSIFLSTKQKRDLIHFILLFSAAFFAMTYNLEKAPFARLIIATFLLTLLHNGFLSWKRLFLLAIGLLIFIIALYIYVAGVSDPSKLFSYNSGLIGRILLTQASAMFLVFDFFPETYNFIGLSSISDTLNMIMNIEDSPRMARLLMLAINPSGVEAGTAGVINTFFMAEAYANFGTLGLLLAPFIVGSLTQGAYIFLLTKEKTPFSTAFLAYLPIMIPFSGGFNGFIYNPAIIFLILASISIFVATHFLKDAQKRTKPGAVNKYSS